MTKRSLPTPEELRQLLRYEPETGKLFWKERPAEMFRDSDLRTKEHSCNQWNGRYSGKEAFTAYLHGYKQGKLLGEYISAHRVAWAVYYGEWPDFEIDHINTIRDDNRINNMRASSREQSSRNRGAQVNNTSGNKGVYWQKLRGKWMAQIQVAGKAIFLGRYENKADAHAAYCAAAEKYHGEFARTE